MKSNLSSHISDILAEFDEKFKCIQSDCDGKGCIPHRIADDEWEPQQCQFHAEYIFPVKSFLTTHLKALAEELKKVIPEEQEKPKAQCMNAENHLFGSCFECKKIEGWNAARTETLKNINEFLK